MSHLRSLTLFLEIDITARAARRKERLVMSCAAEAMRRTMRRTADLCGEHAANHAANHAPHIQAETGSGAV